MDLVQTLTSGSEAIDTIFMHTVGEPTRIVLRGFPKLQGDTLLQKRDFARRHCDHARRLIMHEPRGHRDMYGAILVPDTELTRNDDADIGVLFCHNEGYSTMCGHATIALGRFLVDTQDVNVFPKCKDLLERLDTEKKSIVVKIHAPCGIVRVTVPVLFESLDVKQLHVTSDPSRPVSFLSVPSFAVVTDFELVIPPELRWPELFRGLNTCENNKCTLHLDIAFGGAFYAVVLAKELGFPGEEGTVCYNRDTLKALDLATARVKGLLMDQMPKLLKRFHGIVANDLQFLYGVTVVDECRRDLSIMSTKQVKGQDRNLCFFAGQQLDRSPTGSCVSARVALGMTKKEMNFGETWAYHSIVSEVDRGDGSSEPFLGSAYERVLLGPRGIRKNVGSQVAKGDEIEAFVVEVDGHAWYTGVETFVLEKKDSIGRGFLI